MLFRQLTHDDLGCASYLIGDEDAGVAAVVDPRLDIDEYLRLARYLGVRIEHVLETHNHADHVSGHGRLVAATGATIHIHRAAEPEYEHEPFDDGWELAARARCACARCTRPGTGPSTRRSRSIDTRARRRAVGGADRRLAVRRRHRAPRPRGRQGGGRARHLPLAARARCCALPDACEVWPGPPRRLAVRRPGHGPQDRLDDRLRARAPAAAADRRRGRVRGRDDRGAGPAAAELPRDRRAQPRPARARERRRPPAHAAPGRAGPADGALVVDVRTELQFDEAHIPGAVCITARRAGFGSKLAWLAEPGQPLVLVGRDDEDALAGGGARRRGRAARDRRLPRRRHDVVARGAARRSGGSRA